MKYRILLISLLFIMTIGGALVWVFLGKSPSVPERVNTAVMEPCSEIAFEQDRFIVCEVDSAQSAVSLHLNDDTGKPWGSLKRFAAARKPLFAMNAGMYHDDLRPVGLFVEDGKQITPVNLSGGKGNFFMKPNGVFGVLAYGTPFVQTTEAFVSAGIKPAFATQSGPMLVINGMLHPKFEKDGASRHIRNGVGIDSQGRAVFAISRERVSFGKFARLFRDALSCQNALYFDGVVSAFSRNESVLQGSAFAAGPIVAVFAQKASPSQ